MNKGLTSCWLRLLLSTVALALALPIAAPAARAPGDLDRSFGHRGKVILGGHATDVVVQPNRKVIVLRKSMRRGDPVLVLTRLRKNGDLDVRFGQRGHALIRAGGDAQRVGGLALRSDGRIMVAFTTIVPGLRAGVARFLPNGKPDRSFAGDGIRRITGFGDRSMAPSDVAVAGEGDSVVVGTLNPGSEGGGMHALARYGSRGRLDKTFSDDGIVIDDVTEEHDAIDAGTVDAHDRVIVTGSFWSGSTGFRMTIARYGADGELDPSFAEGGIETSSRPGLGTDVAILPNDGIGVAGAGWRVRGSDFTVTRLSADGSPAPGFGVGGTRVIRFSRRYDRAHALAANGGDLVAVGTSLTPGAGVDGDWAIARILPDGSLDPRFSGNGKRRVAFGKGSSYADDVAVDRRGDVVVVGTARPPGNDEPVAAVIRLRG